MAKKTLPKYDVKMLALADLKDNPKNPRSIKDTALKGLSASIQKFGLIEPIIWNKRTGLIVGGHQRKRALEEAGYKEAQVLIVDFDEDTEIMANISLNNQNIQGEFTEQVSDLLVQYEDLFPEAARELLFPSLAFDLGYGDKTTSGLDVNLSPIYAADEVIDASFKWFRANGFPYQILSKHVAMQQMNRLSALTGDDAIRSNFATHVPDAYNQHRYHERAAGKKSVFDYFQDDKWLRLAIKSEYELGGAIGDGFFGFMNMTSGSQTLSNFRPGFAMYLYRKFGKPGGVILDPCTGYGGRLVGWHCSKLGGHYIGVDPSSKTSKGNWEMAQEFGFTTGTKEKMVTLIEQPFEDSATLIAAALRGQQVDFSFTSPPYFSKEKYSEEKTQSWVRYPSIEEWVDGFLSPMFEINARFLAPGAAFAINITDVKVNGKTIPLEDLTVSCGQKSGLPLEETLRFEIPHRAGSNSEKFTADEPVFIFRKPA